MNLNLSESIKSHPYYKFLVKLLFIIQLITGLVLLIADLVWSYFIIKGLNYLGHLPEYGDTEIISFDGLDRIILIYSTVFMVWGLIIWSIGFTLNIIFKLYRINKLIYVGLIAFAFNLIILFSPSFAWALD